MDQVGKLGDVSAIMRHVEDNRRVKPHMRTVQRHRLAPLVQEIQYRTEWRIDAFHPTLKDHPLSALGRKLIPIDVSFFLDSPVDYRVEGYSLRGILSPIWLGLKLLVATADEKSTW